MPAIIAALATKVVSFVLLPWLLLQPVDQTQNHHTLQVAHQNIPATATHQKGLARLAVKQAQWSILDTAAVGHR